MSKSFETEEETIRFSQDSIASLSIEGFNLTAFASSSKKVLESIPEKDRATPIRDLHVDALPTEYVLGLGWDCTTSDKYHLRVKPMPSVNTRRITFRSCPFVRPTRYLLASILLHLPKFYFNPLALHAPL
jgi:hypothetical protein